LSTLLQRNAQLDAKVRAAAARTASINEQLLRRVSTDLHDGAGQDLGFALMGLESIIGRRKSGSTLSTSSTTLKEDLDAVRSGLQSALADLRAISAGLRLPEIEGLDSAEIAARAVRDFERKTGSRVMINVSGEPVEIALPVKITLYRFLQESLANGFRHGRGIAQRVALSYVGDNLVVKVADGGPGFDASAGPVATHGGIMGMRERVQALGGSFDLKTAPGSGTEITASLPVHVPGVDDD
jgi:signal transduction histidine kinase